jgi:hypothetical protein
LIFNNVYVLVYVHSHVHVHVYVYVGGYRDAHTGEDERQAKRERLALV